MDRHLLAWSAIALLPVIAAAAPLTSAEQQELREVNAALVARAAGVSGKVAEARRMLMKLRAKLKEQATV